MNADRPVLRFAPSPNGLLHLGHAYSALLNARIARELSGRLLLRIEDIDQTRCTPDFEAAIHRDLEWLGMEWERPVRRQSDHFGEYRVALDRLIADGLVYPAFMSRGEIRAHIADEEGKGRPWPRDPDGAPLYPPVDKTLSARERKRRMGDGEPFAWRLDMERAIEAVGGSLHWREFDTAFTPTPYPSPQGGGGSETLERLSSEARTWTPPSPLRGGIRGGGISEPPTDVFRAGGRLPTLQISAQPARWGDVILARKDTPTSYHLSVVLDDALQGVTHVVRGKDLYEATSVQRVLQKLLGLPQPVYHHHNLILGPDGRKLSKSESSTGIAALREGGATPAQVRAMVGF